MNRGHQLQAGAPTKAFVELRVLNKKVGSGSGILPTSLKAGQWGLKPAAQFFFKNVRGLQYGVM
jgi:hypothetical protein